MPVGVDGGGDGGLFWFDGIASAVGKLWWSWWCQSRLSRHGDNSAKDDATDKPTTQGRCHDARNTLATVWQRLAMAWGSGGDDEVAMGCLPPATKGQGAKEGKTSKKGR